MRDIIANHGYQIENDTITMTASFGVSSTDKSTDIAEDLFKLADKRLYKAKSAGRNQVMSKE